MYFEDVEKIRQVLWLFDELLEKEKFFEEVLEWPV